MVWGALGRLGRCTEKLWQRAPGLGLRDALLEALLVVRVLDRTELLVHDYLRLRRSAVSGGRGLGSARGVLDSFR